ncbi:HIT-like domain-containing protein [Phyllosticta capitalensis]|uniref:HIT-like domain-containing protein n=1 Tax=Phyllosticta capitalensis TaxID=121624 RepID=A0ABR1YK51_9PEZI
MNTSGEHDQDAITAEEIAGETVIPAKGSSSGEKRPNAFTELMSRKQAKNTSSQDQKSRKSTTVGTRVFPGAHGLGAYIAAPERFGKDRVIEWDDDFVVIHDLYPKAFIHCLILPRDPEKTLQHPFDAFEDQEFLQKCKAKLEKVKKELVASELRRRLGESSKQEQARNEAMDSDDLIQPADLPPGRDWTQGLLTGIHAHPSMRHLHIHVLSPDRYSPCLKHRNHYNSFSTPFLVPLDAFPLAQDDPRRHPGKEGYLNRDFVCWRCDLNFGNRFEKLKAHLAEEFEEWKKE